MASVTIEQQLQAWTRENLPVYTFIDLKIISASNGLYQCFLPLTSNIGNHINTVHAAFQWATMPYAFSDNSPGIGNISGLPRIDLQADSVDGTC